MVCSAATDLAVIDRSLDPRPEGRPSHRHRRRWLAVTTVCAAVATFVWALGFVALNEVHANTRFDQVHLSVDATHRQLDVVLADLTKVRGNLRVVGGQVGVDEKTLTWDSTELQGLESALTSARTHVWDNTSAIGGLQVCLDGVEQALNALSVNEQTTAVSALDAVSTSCTDALTANG